MTRAYQNLVWFLLASAIVLAAACDLPDPEGLPGGPNGTDPVVDTDCVAALAQCLATCDNSTCGDAVETSPGWPGDMPVDSENSCIDNCRADYEVCISCTTNTCETQLKDCVSSCSAWSQDPTSPREIDNGACIDSCFWQYEQCLGLEAQCWSDKDCNPGYHCEFVGYGQTEPSSNKDAPDMAPSGVCVLDQQPNDCEKQLDACLTNCGVWDCSVSEDGTTKECAPMYADCGTFCWEEYDRCLGNVNGECRFDKPCQVGFHCEFYDCPQGAECMPAEVGMCVPDVQPTECDKQLQECLTMCPPMPAIPCECPPNTDCDCSDPCMDKCYVQYDQCVNNNNGECRSDQDCSSGFHCERYWYDCPADVDCMPPELGTCVPDTQPNECERQLNECLMQCPVYDCACDPNLDYCDCGMPYDPCTEKCNVQFEMCLNGGQWTCLSDADCEEYEFCALADSKDPCDGVSGECFPERPMGVCVPMLD
ncbi:MAG: hypothetical protein MUC50_22555 [Myxococcota bacterium]|jgi:hypothetical protein|nr:hypothetical protein [Myxococcota bacterium]